MVIGNIHWVLAMCQGTILSALYSLDTHELGNLATPFPT